MLLPLPTVQFAAGVILLGYLLSFVFFAFVRVFTGISIQRLGLSSLRRIAYAPKDGLRIELRGLGFTLHRPTFAQPTWISIVLTELTVTVDLKALVDKPRKKTAWAKWAKSSPRKPGNGYRTPELHAEDEGAEEGGDEDSQRTRTWERLTEAKEHIKRLHRKIKWIKLVDVVAVATTFVVVDVGSVQVGSVTMAVDTRRKTVDRSRLFNHHKPKPNKQQRPAEWLFIVRSVLFTPEGKESTEVLDQCTLNVHGMLYQELDGLRDASIGLKLGRLSIPFDDVKMCIERAKKCRAAFPAKHSDLNHSDISLGAVMEEIDQPGSREENIVRTVSDSREFASSILRGIQEFQFAVSFFGLTKRIDTGHATETPVYLNMSIKEVTMDLLRLDPKSPAHLMYFSPNDIAHQALLAAISVSVGVDDGHGHPERLLYLPMATMTLNTTLPSKTIQFSRDKNVIERNTNILFANLVITSPSVDLDPKHVPLLLALFRDKESPRKSPRTQDRRRSLVRRLLPKATVKISIHEPVIRITLPPMDSARKDQDDFDLLISSSSSVSLDLESSHAADAELHYALVSTFRMNSQQLYYQTTSGDKHNLLLTDFLEWKVQLSASPDVVVNLNGTAQTFSVFLVRPEISEGLRQIVIQVQKDVQRRRKTLKRKGINFLRKLPPWLAHIQLHGSDFNIEVAGIDSEVSKHSRGVALHLESWTAEYKQNKSDESESRPARRRAPSRTINRDEYLLRTASPSSSPKSPLKHGDPTDGRRLAVHWQGLEGFVLENADQWEQDPFLSLPRMEVAFTTSSDKQGPIFHTHLFCQSFFFHYSLYRHFALSVATAVLKRSFNMPHSPEKEPTPVSPNAARHLAIPSIDDDTLDPETGLKREAITLDVKAHFVQIKAEMPSDPPVMLHVYGLEAGRHRWTSPFLRSRLVRLYAENPHVKRIWSRIITVKSLRLDYRHSKRRYGHVIKEDKSFDIVADAIRIAVPHQLVMHQIFDNITNVVKTIKQMHHRFQTGTNEYILDKEPEGPKHVPKISLRSRAVLFEIEDGSFEWKLGVIYRYGLMEQKQRLARELAYDLKVKKLRQAEERRGGRQRARSTHTRGRSKARKAKDLRFRSRSEDLSEPESPDKHRPENPMRYDKDGYSGLSGHCRTTIEEAREKLNRLNAQTWRKRIDHAFSAQSRTVDDIRHLFWGLDEMSDEVDHKENIMAISHRPPLASLVISDLDIIIDKPSFPISEYPKFLNDVGKGMPVDMQYALLIPVHVQIQMSEAKVQLRDYPLPLIHIPALRATQSTRIPSLSLKTDFVIAEEYRDHESSRVCKVVVLPEEEDDEGRSTGGYSVDVRRTVAPVKTYSDMKVDINSSYPTRITWGTSYQPAIQDMMQVIESFTKPAVDPSERVGFWDKIRLTFHSRIKVSWKGDGDVHLILKGSRDPYMVTGHGAGFVMCWQNDVELSIAENVDPRNFLVVNSGSYVLAIPDLGHYARQDIESEPNPHSEGSSSISSYRQLAIFKKTIMKLNGNVRWVAGLVFERNLDEGGRSFDFIPHYEVIMKHPQYAKSANGKIYDAFRGFRSHHIHMSLAIAAPHDREWSVANLEPSKTYNSVHLTPRFFTHFFNWWDMFSGAMSLPIRQGPLWPGIEKSSKKFGRHLATIKYNLLLSPLYMSHIYKHKDAEDYGQNSVASTGLKARVDSFMLDLHQRREEFRTVVQAPKNQEDSRQNQTSGMRINQVQLDLIRTDVRAVSASIGGTGEEDINEATDERVAEYNQEQHVTADLSKFTIPDNDWGWVDMDDFVELGWLLPSEGNPDTQILPLAVAPRFTYFRQTDHADNISGDPYRTSPFGHEPTHHCVMSTRNDPRRVQCQLIEQRINQVKEQISQNQSAISDQELKIVRDPDSQHKSRERLELLRNHADVLQRKQDFLLSMHSSLVEKLRTNDQSAVPESENDEDDEYYEAREDNSPADPDTKGMDSAPNADYISDFNNRFIIHNVHLKWNNSLRNIILRYIHQVSQRRGFVYYMSRRAVKFILDIVEEQKRSRQTSAGPNEEQASPLSSDNDDEINLEGRIEQILNDGKNFVNANDPDKAEGNKSSPNEDDEHLAVEYLPQNTYIVRLIAPQIQLQSEKNTKAAVLVTAKGMQLKVVQIMDKDRIMDEVSGLVQRRFTASMDSLQIFVTASQAFKTENIHMYSGSTYGAPAGTAWPPWVPFEVMFEFRTNPFGFQRVVQRTSASLRYDKYNTLRLKYNDDVSGSDSASHKDNMESRVDHLWIDFPHVRALCNSQQYYALYVIVLDLLLYSEPLEKTRNERLEKIMLASDFSDLSGAPDLVVGLQERIRQLEEIKTAFQINEKYLDKQGWNDRIEVEKDLAVFEDELFFVMKAITTAQRKNDDRAQATQSTGLLHWYIAANEIVWHLKRETSQESLAKFQLKNALYDRTDNNDGSNLNIVEVEEMIGLNLLPNAIYPTMISPYHEPGRPMLDEVTKMFKVQWVMLEAIAGIPVMEHFEVNLFPLKVQLEYEIGKKLFEYVFPGIKDSTGENANHSPFLVKHVLPMDDDDEDDAGDNGSIASRNGANNAATFPENESEVNALKLRLTPTLQLPEPQSKSEPSPRKERRPMHHLRIFRDNSSRTGTELRRSLHPSSAYTNLDLSPTPAASRPVSVRSGSASTHQSVATTESGKSSKRFTLHRSITNDKRMTDNKQEKQARNDDLTQMMTRASNYMTLSYVRIPSMILCLSYKGKGQRNFEDVHDLVFKMPTLEYRNKTWSNLDLALQLKRDVIRALISHAGAIVGNKFSHHRPSKHTQSRLRQIANSSSLVSTSPELSGAESSSVREHSPGGSDNSSERPGRRSFASGRANSTFSALSEEGSVHSSKSQGNRMTASNSANDTGSIMTGSWASEGLGLSMGEMGDESVVEDGRTFADEISRVDQTEPEHAGVIGSLSRHLTGVTGVVAHRKDGGYRERPGSSGRDGVSSRMGGASIRSNGKEKERASSFSVSFGGGEDETDGTKKKSKFSKLLGRNHA